MASDYSNIGDVYFQMREFDKAKNLYQKALIYYSDDKKANNFFHGYIKFQLAKIYFANEDINLALSFALDGKVLMESLNNHSPEINSEEFRSEYLLRNHFILARIFSKEKDFESSNLELTRSLYYINEYKMNEFLSEYYLLKSQNHFSKFKKIENPEKLLYYLNESRKQKKHSLALEIFELLRNVSLNNKDYQAFISFSDSINLYTSVIFKINKAKAISQYQAEFETQKANFEAQQAELLTQKEKRKGFIYLGSLLISLLSLSFIVYYLKNKQKAQQSKIKIKDLKISSLLHKNELENLNGQIEGQEKERNRIAQDLHDSVGGMLASLKMHFNAIISNNNFENKHDKVLFNSANNLLDESCTEVRRVAHDLHTIMKKKGGIQTQLINLKNSIELTNKMDVTIFYDLEEGILSYNTEKQLYKITLELISNTLKHAEADKVELQITGSKKEIDYIFEDNGKGLGMFFKLCLVYS